MNTKHTPLPWRRASTAAADEYSTRILDSRKNTIAICPMPADGSADYEVAEANAAHIVHCVNQHAALVAALAGIVANYNGQIDCLNPIICGEDFIADARALLAAEGVK